MNNQLHNQIKQLSDRELLEGIYQMLLVVMQEQLISDSKQFSYVLSANNELMTCYVGEEKATLAGTYKQTGANMSLFLSENNNKTRFGSMAFYKSILFDSVPTKETDGFTEQDLIDYVLENLITK